jgi:hypothetical protein
MIQYDPSGEILFFHRNSVKLTGLPNQPHTITHIQQYRADQSPRNYRVGQIISELGQESCYHIRSNRTDPVHDDNHAFPTFITPIEYTPFALIEPTAIRYSIEGRGIEERAKRQFYVSWESIFYICGLLCSIVLVYWRYMQHMRGHHDRRPVARWKSTSKHR